MKISCAILLVLALALTGRAAPAAASAPRDNFDFTQAGHHVKVWYHAPAGLGADAPVVFVMHGVGRNGEDYRNNWTAAADAHRFLLVVPEFSKAEFPGDDGYNYGNTVDKIGAPLPREPWSFNMIEPIFDAVRTRLGSRRANYLIFGHSAGAQFVQRFLYFVPAARATHVIAANAGWYMLPELGADFPYGLKGTPMNEAALRGAFARPDGGAAGRGGHRCQSHVAAPFTRVGCAGPRPFRSRPIFLCSRPGDGAGDEDAISMDSRHRTRHCAFQ